MSPDFELLRKHLRDETAEVELDVPGAAGSSDEATASRLARARLVAIRRGDRVARLYKLVDGARRSLPNGQDQGPDLETGVTENECRTLIAAGAVWVGPKQYLPKPRPYVDRLRVRNFRCIQEVSFPLTPLHALIGPNDSGKSTLLDALGVFANSGQEATTEITAFSAEQALTAAATKIVGHMSDVPARGILTGQRLPNNEASESLWKLVRPVRALRLDPDAMRQPTGLIPQGHPLEYDPRGYGLAAVYDALLSRRIDVFLEISQQFKTLFPTARAIQLTNPSHTTKALGVELVDGRSIGAQRLSEGMLYWLAFAALPYLHPTPLILIEEPENGLHPSRIGEVMRVLREVSNTSQIIVATHHPLVINELQADEVTIITRTPERGTIATPLSQTKNFAQRSQIYALGELWLNYADGDLESDLVGESTIPASSTG